MNKPLDRQLAHINQIAMAALAVPAAMCGWHREALGALDAETRGGDHGDHLVQSAIIAGTCVASMLGTKPMVWNRGFLEAVKQTGAPSPPHGKRKDACHRSSAACLRGRRRNDASVCAQTPCYDTVFRKRRQNFQRLRSRTRNAL